MDLIADQITTALGLGCYTAPEAARLLNFSSGARAGRSSVQVTSLKLSRWLRGYSHDHHGHVRSSAPLWTPDFQEGDGPLELSFRDLVELRFVKAFMEAGLSLLTVRRCFDRAREHVGNERPFSTRRFRTDGKTIFLEITRDLEEAQLLDLNRRQLAFHRLIEPSLSGLEFDADQVARWFPLGDRRQSIVIDPARAFGRPLTAEYGVATFVLADAVTVEGSISEVSRLYDVPPRVVRDAVEFEGRLAA